MEITFQQAIRNKDFKTALAMIENGDDLLKSEFIFKIEDSFRPILQGEAFEVMDALIEEEVISVDVFEYDTFQGSIFNAIVDYLPNTDNAKEFLAKFISNVENLNDSVANKTFLGLAIENLVQKDILEIMLDNGCDVNYANNAEQTFLHCVTSLPTHLDENKKLDIMQVLIDYGIDISKKDNNGNNALHLAIEKRFNSGVKLLLEQGLDPNEENNKGYSAFAIASNTQNNEVTELLNQYSSVDTEELQKMCYKFVTSIYSKTPSESEMSTFKSFEGVNIYLPVKDFYGNTTTILDEILKKGYDWFETLVEIFDLDIDYTDDFGNSILHKICAIDLNFDETKSKDLYKIAKKLLKMGANPSLSNNEDKTPIDLASDDNLKEKIVAILIKAKVS